MSSKPRRGKPWTQIINDFVLPPESLHKIGKFLVATIINEAKKEHAKQRGRRPGEPMGLPDAGEFYDSFSYQILNNQIEVMSSWPGFEVLVEGKEKYPMRWLKSENKKPLIVPMREHGTNKLIFRMAPLKVGEYWIHPGVAKHTFLEKAKEKTLEEVKRLIIEGLGDLLQKGDPTK